MNITSDSMNHFDDFQRHRLEAIDLLERCLSENTPLPLERWLQGQIVGAHTALQLFSDIEESLHHQLMGLLRAQLDTQPAGDGFPPNDLHTASQHRDGQIALLMRLHRFVHDWMRALSLMAVWNVWQIELDTMHQ
ncbi:MAG: hypothetical protein SGI73_08580 [Chloroflexota bacterium]|nr:hypothetical protein [Chloroflexota bacterium]